VRLFRRVLGNVRVLMVLVVDVHVLMLDRLVQMLVSAQAAKEAVSRLQQLCHRAIAGRASREWQCRFGNKLRRHPQARPELRDPGARRSGPD